MLTRWQVEIQGSWADLEHLTSYFTSAPFVVWKDDRGAGCLYESETFAECSTSEQVFDQAEKELLLLSGVLRLLCDSSGALRTGAVYRANAAGGRDILVHIAEAVQVRDEAKIVSAKVTDSQGNVVSIPLPRTTMVYRLAWKDLAVAKVMRLLASPDCKSWVNLYRIYEVVEADVGGESLLQKQAWGSSRDLKRFKHSANSVTVAGDSARHGKEFASPPPWPMSISYADDYVKCLLHAWLASKGA